MRVPRVTTGLPMPDEDRYHALKKIKEEVLALDTTSLPAYRREKGCFPVIGEGDHFSKLMFIGEAPGRTEAQTGRPFVGAAGRVLEELLASVGARREDVYIANILKDRPPENRDPFPEEIEVYGPFLDRQIEIIKPRILATLGRYAMSYVMERFGLTAQIQPISYLHGKAFEAEAPHGPITIVCLYHPAVAVYNSNMKEVLKKDFQILREYIGK